MPRSASFLFAAIALAAPLACPAPSLAQGRNSRGFVYVESNDPNGNAILAYKQNDDGTLTPVPGSPFATGGKGISPTFDLGPYDSDQEIITNPNHTLLFAVNGGSDSISVFRIRSDGRLTPVEGSPFPSGGSNPVSVGWAGDLLAVVNKDQNPGHPGRFAPNYTTFKVSSEGRLTPVPKSTVTVDLGSSPSQALIAPGQKLLFGADFLGGVLRSFVITSAGRLVPADAQPLPFAEFADTGAPAFPLGLAAHPDRRLLYVGFVTINRLAIYHYSRDGALFFLRTVPNSGKALCWVLVNPDGSRLYTSNTGDNSISVYDLTADPAEPIEIQKVTLNGMSNAFQIALDASGGYFYVVGQRAAATLPASANALHVLQVADDGTLTEVDSSPIALPVPASVRPQGVVAF